MRGDPLGACGSVDDLGFLGFFAVGERPLANFDWLAASSVEERGLDGLASLIRSHVVDTSLA